jgi:cell division protein FtsB
VPLVQAVKEQQAQIDQQKKENEILKKQLQFILEKLEKLEQKNK